MMKFLKKVEEYDPVTLEAAGATGRHFGGIEPFTFGARTVRIVSNRVGNRGEHPDIWQVMSEGFTARLMVWVWRNLYRPARFIAPRMDRHLRRIFGRPALPPGGFASRWSLLGMTARAHHWFLALFGAGPK
jgi:hypothetical protein